MPSRQARWRQIKKWRSGNWLGARTEAHLSSFSVKTVTNVTTEQSSSQQAVIAKQAQRTLACCFTDVFDLLCSTGSWPSYCQFVQTYRGWIPWSQERHAAPRTPLTRQTTIKHTHLYEWRLITKRKLSCLSWHPELVVVPAKMSLVRNSRLWAHSWWGEADCWQESPTCPTASSELELLVCDRDWLCRYAPFC